MCAIAIVSLGVKEKKIGIKSSDSNSSRSTPCALVRSAKLMSTYLMAPALVL